MTTPLKHTIIIVWSEGDNCFLVYLPDFGNSTDQPPTRGKTYEEALANAQKELQMLIDFCEDDGREIPSPLPLLEFTSECIRPALRIGDLAFKHSLP